jgi:hypothetical protein
MAAVLDHAPRCIETTRTGDPCRGVPLPGTPYCRFHAPELAEQNREWKAAGGRNRSNVERAVKRIPADMRQMQNRLYEAFAAVESGAMTATTAGALSTLARAICDVYETGVLQLEIEELKRKLAEPHDA